MLLELGGDVDDAGHLAVAAVALDGEAEALCDVPGECVPVDGAGRLLPVVERFAVERSPLAVVGEREVEDDAVGVELRVVVSG